jgi:hypothetical protein
MAANEIEKFVKSDKPNAVVPILEPRDIADAVLYVLAAPSHVQVGLCALAWRNWATTTCCHTTQYRLVKNDTLLIFY